MIAGDGDIRVLPSADVKGAAIGLVASTLTWLQVCFNHAKTGMAGVVMRITTRAIPVSALLRYVVQGSFF